MLLQIFIAFILLNYWYQLKRKEKNVPFYLFHSDLVICSYSYFKLQNREREREKVRDRKPNQNHIMHTLTHKHIFHHNLFLRLHLFAIFSRWWFQCSGRQLLFIIAYINHMNEKKKKTSKFINRTYVCGKLAKIKIKIKIKATEISCASVIHVCKE